MRITLKSLMMSFGLAAMTAATQAQAMSVKELFDDTTMSKSTRGTALVLSLTTEAYRNSQAGFVTKADCIEENFVAGKEDPPGFVALTDHMQDAKNRGADVEGYVLRAVEAYCPAGGVAQISDSSGRGKFEPTPVQAFYKVVPDNADKVVALNLAISTQETRVGKTERRGQCIDGLQVKTVDNRRVIPDAFRLDIMQKLAAANTSASSDDSVESIVMAAINKNCGPEKPSSVAQAAPGMAPNPSN